MSPPCSRLWLAIRFSDLPLTALKLDDAIEKPVVVIQKKRVIYANAQAEKAGALLDMDITTAQLLSSCEVVERDEEKERLVLNELSEKFYHFSHYIDRYCSNELAQSALLMEISSCLKLFGGVKAFSEMVFTYLVQVPYEFAFGLAHSGKAAWYLSAPIQRCIQLARCVVY